MTSLVQKFEPACRSNYEETFVLECRISISIRSFWLKFHLCGARLPVGKRSGQPPADQHKWRGANSSRVVTWQTTGRASEVLNDKHSKSHVVSWWGQEPHR